MKLAWNGHLLPGFAAIGNRITLPATRRGQIRPLWGAAEITYVSPDGKRSYTVRHSKRAGLRLSWRILRGALRLWRGHDRLSADWRAGYDRLTGSDFWKTRLGLTPD